MREHKTKDSDEQLLKHLAKLPDKEQEHFKLLVRMLAKCYGPDAPASGVLIVRDHRQIALMSVNANDLDVTEIVMSAADAMSEAILEDAPPKEMFN
jgi:hypothetical protein